MNIVVWEHVQMGDNYGQRNVIYSLCEMIGFFHFLI